MYIRLLAILMMSSFFTFSSCAPEKKKSTRMESTSKADDSDAKKKAKIVEKTTTDAAASGASPEQLEKAKSIIANVGAKDLEGIDAKKKFKTFCATCHGFTGDLNVNGAKDLTASKISLEESVAQVYHGKGLMTPFKGILSDAEIVAVAKWIEGLRK